MYALKPGTRYKRKYEIPADPFRCDFVRDRDRIIYSKSFHKLQYRTQVFHSLSSDFMKTRLTHSIHVSQISRVIARNIRANEDVCEAVSLAHDLGHCPLGHYGESILSNFAEKHGYFFNHNLQNFKLLTFLESPYNSYKGLNLTYEVLDAIIKHNGPIKDSKMLCQYKEFYLHWEDRTCHHQGTLEAQICSLSDDISYLSHDLYDGLEYNLFDIDCIVSSLPFIRDIFEKEGIKYSDISKFKLKKCISALTHFFVKDVVDFTKYNINANAISDFYDIINCNSALVCFSDSVDKKANELKSFLLNNMYNHADIINTLHKYGDEMSFVIESLTSHGDLFFDDVYFSMFSKSDWPVSVHDRVPIVIDWIASMTDFFIHKKYLEIIR